MILKLVQTIGSQIDISPLPHVAGDPSQVPHILQVVFGVVGALALLFIVIAGFRYIISAGDPQDTAKAKNGIIYALVGLALAITAEAIVTWVVGSVK